MYYDNSLKLIIGFYSNNVGTFVVYVFPSIYDSTLVCTLGHVSIALIFAEWTSELFFTYSAAHNFNLYNLAKLL